MAFDWCPQFFETMLNFFVHRDLCNVEFPIHISKSAKCGKSGAKAGTLDPRGSPPKAHTCIHVPPTHSTPTDIRLINRSRYRGKCVGLDMNQLICKELNLLTSLSLPSRPHLLPKHIKNMGLVFALVSKLVSLWKHIEQLSLISQPQPSHLRPYQVQNTVK